MSLVGAAPLDRGPTAASDPTRPPGVAAARVVLALTAIILILSQSGRMTSQPGLSHDGQNLGVFALGSRGLRTDGPIESHLGADLAYDQGTYANHPPLLYWSIATTESLFGERPWATRLPTILAALATIPLLFSVLRRSGFQPLPAAAGVAIALGNPLFSIYGWMPDTPMLALPFALATVLAWQRSRESGHVLALGASAAMACLAGWQGVVMCGTLAVVAAVETRRGRPWRTALVLAAATGITASLVLAWSYWSYGSFDTLFHSAGYRIADGGLSLSEVVRTQSHFLAENWRLPMLLAVPIGAVLAWRNPVSRQLLLILTVVVVGYSVIFWQAATIHRYWTLWAVAPVALCIAALCQAAIDRPGLLQRRPVILGVIAIALSLTSVVRSSAAEYEFELGAATRPAVDAPIAEGQTISYAVGMVDPRWTTYSTHRPVRRLDHDELAELARVHPEWTVLLNCVLRRVDGGPPPCTRLEDPSAVWAEPLVATRADAALAAIESR